MNLRQAQRSLAELIVKCRAAHIQLPEDPLEARVVAVEAVIESQNDGKVDLSDAQDKLQQRLGLDPKWKQQLEESEAKRQRRRDAGRKRAAKREKGAAGTTATFPTTGARGMRLELASQSPLANNSSDAASNLTQQGAGVESNDEKQAHADLLKAITAQAAAAKRFAADSTYQSNNNQQSQQTHGRPTLGMKYAKKAKSTRTLLLSATSEDNMQQLQQQDESLLEEKPPMTVVDDTVQPNVKASHSPSDRENTAAKEAELFEFIDELCSEDEDDDLGSDEEFTL